MLSSLRVSESAAELIGKSGGVQDVLAALRLFPDDADLATSVCGAVWSLAVNGRHALTSTSKIVLEINTCGSLKAIFHYSRFARAGGATNFHHVKNQSRGHAKKVECSSTLRRVPRAGKRTKNAQARQRQRKLNQYSLRPRGQNGCSGKWPLPIVEQLSSLDKYNPLALDRVK